MNSNTVIELKEKDDDDSEFPAVALTVGTVENGWILTLIDEDDNEYVEVYKFSEIDQMTERIQQILLTGE